MELQVIDAQGKSASTVSASDDVFGREYNGLSFTRSWLRIKPTAVAATVRRKLALRFVTRQRSHGSKGHG